MVVRSFACWPPAATCCYARRIARSTNCSRRCTPPRRHRAEADALCGLFDPGADRSLAGLNAVASQLGPASRARFANAVANVLVGAMQSPPQRYDAAAARQSLKAAGVTAAILHDGFVAGLNADGNAPDATQRALPVAALAAGCDAGAADRANARR